MLDPKYVRANPEKVAENLRRRGTDLKLDAFLDLDARRRDLLVLVEEKKQVRNQVSKEIGAQKKAGKDPAEAMENMRLLGDEIQETDREVRQLEEQIESILLSLPNMLHESVPEGASDADNPEVRRWGNIPEFSYEPKAHWELGESLDIIDAQRAGKVSGARFTYMKGDGARLERALMNFMLDLHARQGYTEIVPPFLVNADSMRGTGQLPKFAEDMFHIENTELYLIPTAEVPLTNMLGGEILDNQMLPYNITAYSPCFRAEAGSAGRDTRGLIRQHQFNKVEMVKFVRPEDSYQELENLVNHAAEILELLELPYRVVTLCTRDVGFSSAKTYDLEVWLPQYGGYREISSCSNFEDFQARRANIRFRREPKGKAEYLHTLNGSGLAIGRTVAAILENYQLEDGTIRVPGVLIPYMGGKEIIGS